MSLSLGQLRALTHSLVAAKAVPGPDSERPREVRRAQGAFFTPPALVSFVVKEALDRLFATHSPSWHANGYPLLRVLDPAAGDGRFLLEAMESLVQRGQELGHATNARLVRKHCLVAIERDPHYAAIAAERLGDATVHCGEALQGGLVEEQTVDLVLGNPPYLRSIALGRSDASLRNRLREKYAATSHGEWDLYAAFLEQGLRWLGDGGQLAMVVPSRWWTAKWAGPFRERVARLGSLTALVDFGDAQIFSGATVYASLCFAGAVPSSRVEVGRYSSAGWELGSVATEELLGSDAWDLSVGTYRSISVQLKTSGILLGDVARIAKGTGTNADGVFLVCDAQTNIESELLHSVLRGRDVRAMGDIPEWPKLLVPYDVQGVLIEPSAMKTCYPMAYAHLLAHRQRLEARESGRFIGEQFYCHGRPQNLRFLRDASAKVVVPDITKHGRALVDCSGAMVLDSAYALRLHADAPIDHDTLCGILNSRLVRLWLTSQGLPLRGGYTRMKTAYLERLPMPILSDALGRIGVAVRRQALPQEVDELVRIAYGLSTELWCLSGT